MANPILDPSKVKAGDLVSVDIVSTADAGEYMVAGRAYRHSPHGPLFVGGHALIAANVTLTNHEPAPEPEVEWKPGTVAVIEVDGDNTYRAIRNDSGQWDAENAWTYGDSEVTDVRPLVVIDPAAARESLEVAGFDDSTILSVSLLLGIEAP